MVARLDDGAILTKCGRYDRDELVEYCLVLLKSAQNSKSGRAARSLQTGPAIKAKKAAKKFKKTGMWPADPYEGKWFAKSGDGKGRGPSHFGLKTSATILKQDAARDNRLMSELMHRAEIAADTGIGDRGLTEQGARTQLVSVSSNGTRALGMAVQDEQMPPPRAPFWQLTCLYEECESLISRWTCLRQ